MHSSLKSLGQAAPQRFAFPVRDLGLAHVVSRRLLVVPCDATGTGSALRFPRLGQRALTSLRPAPPSLSSTNRFSRDFDFVAFIFGGLCTSLIAGAALVGVYFDWQKKVETQQKTIETS